jgi:glutamyl-tRNA synthetase
MDELINSFSLDRVNKAGAVFDLQKLNWLNAEHLRNKTNEELLNLLKEEIQKSKFKNQIFSDDYLLLVIEAMKERVSFVKEFIDTCLYFYEAPAEYEQKSIEKNWKAETPAQLTKLIEEFIALNNPAREDFEQALIKVSEELNVGKGKLIHPLRLAVSGQSTGPGMFDLLFILGKEEVVKRIESAVLKIKI